jgi:hypothetical protein
MNHEVPPSKTLCHYRGLPFGSPNTVYVVRLRSPKCSASPRTSHTPSTLGKMLASGHKIKINK